MIEKLSTRFYGKVGFLLLLVAALNFGYPLTLYVEGVGNIIFLLAYALMFVIGVLVTSEDNKHFIQTSVAAVVWMVCAVISFFCPIFQFCSHFFAARDHPCPVVDDDCTGALYL